MLSVFMCFLLVHRRFYCRFYHYIIYFTVCQPVFEIFLHKKSGSLRFWGLLVYDRVRYERRYVEKSLYFAAVKAHEFPVSVYALAVLATPKNNIHGS